MVLPQEKSLTVAPIIEAAQPAVMEDAVLLPILLSPLGLVEDVLLDPFPTLATAI